MTWYPSLAGQALVITLINDTPQASTAWQFSPRGVKCSFESLSSTCLTLSIDAEHKLHAPLSMTPLTCQLIDIQQTA